MALNSLIHDFTKIMGIDVYNKILRNTGHNNSKTQL